MTELETLRRAKMYIDKLANGVDPITGGDVSDDSVINNVRISRCLFYVSGVLQKVIENGGEVKKTVIKGLPFRITDEQLGMIEISEAPVGVSIIAKRIAAVLDEGVKNVSASKISTWLVNEGYLVENIRAGERSKEATEKGEAIGIFTVDGTSLSGREYKKNIYNADAQRFIISNIVQIAEETM